METARCGERALPRRLSGFSICGLERSPSPWPSPPTEGKGFSVFAFGFFEVGGWKRLAAESEPYLGGSADSRFAGWNARPHPGPLPQQRGRDFRFLLLDFLKSEDGNGSLRRASPTSAAQRILDLRAGTLALTLALSPNRGEGIFDFCFWI